MSAPRRPGLSRAGGHARRDGRAESDGGHRGRMCAAKVARRCRRSNCRGRRFDVDFIKKTPWATLRTPAGMRCLCFSLPLLQTLSSLPQCRARRLASHDPPRGAARCGVRVNAARGGARPNLNEARLAWPRPAGAVPEIPRSRGPRGPMAEDVAASLYARTLHEVTLPGTHDSGAYWLTKQTIPDARFPPGWAAAAIAAAERLGVPVDEIITVPPPRRADGRAVARRVPVPGPPRGLERHDLVCTTPRWAWR